MPPVLRLVALLRAFWPVAAGGGACLAAAPVLLGQAAPGKIGQAAVCAGAFIQVLVGAALLRARPGKTESLAAPYVAAWVLVPAGFALQAPGWLH